MIHSKRRTIGILAHVDAGKTTLSESLLYNTGTIRKLGRVDHQNAFLDTDSMERSRGITIFSKQAEFLIGELPFTLLDTPGHVDFSAEMERTLQVLDYAILVISGADGVQGHTMTLWKLLKQYEVPVFLFINKMDQPGTDKEALLAELQKRLSPECLDFTDFGDDLYENLATQDEELMEQFLEGETPSQEQIARIISERKAFPCYFGSALKNFGVEELIRGLEQYTEDNVYGDDFGARVYKITRDNQNQRLTHLRITGGALKVKGFITGTSDGEEWSEKIDQIRIYSGTGYKMVQEAEAGTVCAVTGLTHTASGQGLGVDSEKTVPILEPVLTYKLLLPRGVDPHNMLLKMRELEEEEPQLHVVWDEDSQEIHAQVMGEVEIEVLRSQIRERFAVPVDFGNGSLIYKETISEAVEGVGHFEPLRHYAEVHVMIEPGEPGSGVQIAVNCSEDILAKNWQRLIVTHLLEKRHKGTLTGSEITDIRITLINGRAHIKHTEGGDFRQATYRAVRQGLRKAMDKGKAVLLEPVYDFELEIPQDTVGRAMADVQKMQGEITSNEPMGENVVLKGWAPVSEMREYPKEVTVYSRGSGRIFLNLKGYRPCHNQDEVVESSWYDPEADLLNPTGSVFCAHGAGFLVPWDQVEDYMHIEAAEVAPKPVVRSEVAVRRDRTQVSLAEEKELESIFERTYGAIPRDRNKFNRNIKRERIEEAQYRHIKLPIRDEKEKYLLVDGYNIIFAWEDLSALARQNLGAARDALIELMVNYQGFTEDHLILVFDAYKVKGQPGEILKYGEIFVVYTKEAETADQYIEKTVHDLGHKYAVTVATSDALEQMIIWGEGARRMSARELKEEVALVEDKIRETYEKKNDKTKNQPLKALLKENQNEQ